MTATEEIAAARAALARLARTTGNVASMAEWCEMAGPLIAVIDLAESLLLVRVKN